MTEEASALIGAWAEASREAAEWRERLGHIEWELTCMMQAEGATALSHPDYEVRLASRPTYDYGKLAPLRELIPQAEIDKACIPEHKETVTVPEKWDMRTALTFKKFGRDVEAILDGARVDGEPRISIKPKKGAAGGN